MSRELYRQNWHDRHVTHALVRAEPGASRDVLRTTIAKRFGARYSLRILSVQELIDWFASQAQRAFSAIYALGLMVLIVVAIGVADTIAAGVVDRRREHAAMNTLGVRRRAISRMIFSEALLLAIGGITLAFGAGLLLGILWVKVTFADLVGWVLELHIPVLYFLFTTLLAMSVCLLAALSSAVRGARVPPAEALRYE